jgi:tetratricopeptide (TPR) repeat protein
MRGSLGLARLLYDAGFNSWERERIPDGIQMLDLAENVLNGLGHNLKDSLRADIHAIQGMFTDSAGGSQRTIGLKRRQEAVNIRREVIRTVRREGRLSTRTQEILLQNSVNDYAYCLLQSNRYAEAEPLFEACFEKYQQWGTEKEIPFEYSKYFHNIGTVRMYQGRHEEAVTNLQRATDLTQKAMGKTQMTYKLLRDRYMYACVLLQAGKLQEAYEVHLEVLKDRESLCGEQNELTLESLYAVGAMCEYLGDLEGAR